MAIDISQRIKKMYPSLSKGHKKIANAVLNEYETVSYMTASRLGNRVGVSESTVVRFAGVLGYEGYSEFQRAVEELAKTKLTPNQRIDMTKQRIGKGDILEKVMHSDMNKIRYTLDKLDRNAFYKSVDAILAAKTIYIIGARSAAPLARFIAYYFNLMFDNARFINTASTSELFEQVMRIGEGDVMIGVSFPRYSTQTTKAFSFAASNGADTIAITDSYSSPLAQSATHVLMAKSDMASFVDSLVAPMSLINALIVAIGIKKREEISANFERLEDIWDKYDVYEKHKDEEQ